MTPIRKRFAAILVACTLVLAMGCAGNPIPIIVGEAATVVSASIDSVGRAGEKLEQASLLPTAVALNFQEKLVAANAKLKPLSDLLRTIDRMQQAGEEPGDLADKAIGILSVVGQDISVVIAGVPLSDATAVLIDLVRAAQSAVQSVLVEVARIKGRES